jgi:predicted NAD/FAD-dependent oxidoreductase
VHHHLDRDLSYAWLYHSVSPEIKTVSCEHLKPGRPNRPAWVISSGLTFCNQHLDDNQENAIDLIIKRLCETFGLPEDMVNNYHVLHRWRYSKVKKALDKGFLWDESLNLGVCGDSLIGALGQDAIESSVRLVDNCFNS